jgi:hypothetical protein
MSTALMIATRAESTDPITRGDQACLSSRISAGRKSFECPPRPSAFVARCMRESETAWFACAVARSVCHWVAAWR